MTGRAALLRPRPASPAPPPRIARAREADLCHQSSNGLSVETDRGRELGIHWVRAASGAYFPRVAGEPIGEVDPDPGPAATPICERCAAGIRIAAEHGRSGRWKCRHRLSLTHRLKRGPPKLRGGFQKLWLEHIERTQAHTKPVQRLAVRLLEMADRAQH